MSTTTTTTMTPWKIITSMASATASYNTTFSIPVFASFEQTTPIASVSIGVEYSSFDFECLGVTNIHPNILSSVSSSGCQTNNFGQTISKVRFGWYDTSTHSSEGVVFTASSSYEPAYKLFDLNFRSLSWGSYVFNFEESLSEYSNGSGFPVTISPVLWQSMTMSIDSPFTQSFTTTTSTTTLSPVDYTFTIGNVNTYQPTFSVPVFINPQNQLSQFIKLTNINTSYFWSDDNLECNSITIIDNQLKNWEYVSLNEVLIQATNSITNPGFLNTIISGLTSSGFSVSSNGVNNFNLKYNWFQNRSELSQIGTSSSIDLLVYTQSSHLFNLNFSFKNFGAFPISASGSSGASIIQINPLTGETFSNSGEFFSSDGFSVQGTFLTQSLTPSVLSTLDTWFIGGGAGVSTRTSRTFDGGVIKLDPAILCEVRYDQNRRLLRRHDFSFYGSWTMSSPTYSGYSYSVGQKPPVSSYIINSSSINTTPGSSSSFSVFTFSFPGTFSFNEPITVLASTTQSSYNRNSTDALQIAKYFAQIDTPNAIQRKASDVNLSRTVNATDALLVQRRYVFLINSFLAGEWVLHPATFSLSELSLTQSSGTEYLYLPISVCNTGQLRP